MELEHHSYCYIMSWCSVCIIYYNELDIMDRIKLCSSTFQYPYKLNSCLDVCIIAIDIYWCILWFQRGCYENANKNQSNPSTDTRSVNIYTTDAGHNHGRHITIWMYIHPIILHSQQSLVKSNVLHVWLPVFSIYHIGYNL